MVKRSGKKVVLKCLDSFTLKLSRWGVFECRALVDLKLLNSKVSDL